MAARSCFIFTMTNPRDIKIEDYSYDLPADFIAHHPLPDRDASRLLVYKKGNISEDKFSQIADLLPENSLVIFNNTKVINARLKFQKDSGAAIEIFCLEPAEQGLSYEQVMQTTGNIRLRAFIGGAAKWKDGWLEKPLRLHENEILLQARILEKETDHYIVELQWTPGHYIFADVIEAAGEVPLPPYIKRNAEPEDRSRYQTIYAAHDGSVAAPTAGLHFTPAVLDSLAGKNISTDYVTLHVGAGTFKPVSASTMSQHEMHAEFIDVELQVLEKIAAHAGEVAAVGTTSLRTLETLYWLGLKISSLGANENIELGQWEIYDGETENQLPVKESLQALVEWLKKNNKERLFAKTRLLIVPGYKFRVCHMLITNFHQPKSTLLLLVAAAVGEDWKKIYAYALENNFRFLSYGDSSLLFMAES